MAAQTAPVALSAGEHLAGAEQHLPSPAPASLPPPADQAQPAVPPTHPAPPSATAAPVEPAPPPCAPVVSPDVPVAGADPPGPYRPPEPVAEPSEAEDPPASTVKEVERAHPLTPLAKGWFVLVGFGGYALRELIRSGEPSKQLPLDLVLGGVLAVVVLACLVGLASWLTTKFIADDDELRVESGWLKRSSRRISYSRIQSVDVVQPMAARLLGLAGLQIDAGGDSTTLQYLARRRAYQTRDDLMRRAHGHRTGETPREASESGLLQDLGSDDEVLVRVQPQQLLLGALLSHDLAGLVTAFVMPAVVVTSLTWLWPDAAWLRDARRYAALGSLLPIGLAVLSYLSNRVVAQFNYTLARTPAGLRITRGLTSLTSQTVLPHRIQSIRIAQPLAWRWLRRWRLDVEVLGYGRVTTDEDTTQVSTILLPIGDQQQVAAALAAVWPGLRLEELSFTGSPARARWLDWLSYGWNGIARDDTVVVTRRGWLTRLQSIVPHARLQSVRADQGPLERRLRLASIWFHTTGTMTSHGAVHLDADEARRLVYQEVDLARASGRRAASAPVGTGTGLDSGADDGGMRMPRLPQNQQGSGPAGPLHPDRVPTGPLNPDQTPTGPLLPDQRPGAPLLPGQHPAAPLLPQPKLPG
ncbi:MAG: PH domain-containing protein [Actinomycetia bacterium]|nr:PH domain-containing protein [Actinomycetes bacterium]